MKHPVTDQGLQLGGVTVRREGQGWCALVPYYLCVRPSLRGRPLKVRLGATWTTADLLGQIAPHLAPAARQRFEQALQAEGVAGPGQEPAKG